MLRERVRTGLVLAFWALAGASMAQAQVPSGRLDSPAAGQVRGVGRGAALQAYVDPVTGELTSPPTLGAEGVGASDETSDAVELSVVPAPSAAGGVMIDLQGQFIYATRAYAEPGGAVAEECLPATLSPLGD